MEATVTPVNEEEENEYSYTSDGPQDYNYEPVRPAVGQEQGRIWRNNSRKRAESCGVRSSNGEQRKLW